MKGDSGFLVILFLAFFFNRKLIQRTHVAAVFSVRFPTQRLQQRRVGDELNNNHDFFLDSFQRLQKDKE